MKSLFEYFTHIISLIDKSWKRHPKILVAQTVFWKTHPFFRYFNCWKIHPFKVPIQFSFTETGASHRYVSSPKVLKSAFWWVFQKTVKVINRKFATQIIHNLWAINVRICYFSFFWFDLSCFLIFWHTFLLEFFIFSMCTDNPSMVSFS